MYGERTLRIQMATGQVLDDFQGRNKSFSQNKSAYFSALGRLMLRNGEMTVTLFENMFAAVPIPYCRRVLRSFGLSRRKRHEGAVTTLLRCRRALRLPAVHWCEGSPRSSFRPGPRTG